MLQWGCEKPSWWKGFESQFLPGWGNQFSCFSLSFVVLLMLMILIQKFVEFLKVKIIFYQAQMNFYPTVHTLHLLKVLISSKCFVRKVGITVKEDDLDSFARLPPPLTI